MRYFIEPRTRKYVKWYGFFSNAEKNKRKIIGYSARCYRNYFQKCKIADAVTRSSDALKQEPVEELIIPLEQRHEMLEKLRQALLKWNTIKYLNY